MLRIYDLEGKKWFRIALQNAPLVYSQGFMQYGRTVKRCSMSKEVQTVAIIKHANDYLLSKLDGKWWNVCSITDSKNYHGHSFCSILNTEGRALFIRSSINMAVMVRQSISLQDMALKNHFLLELQ